MSEPTPESTPQEPTPTEPAAAKSFTQDDVNALLAKQKRENFGDYGDLRKAAEELAQIKQSQQSEQERAAETARQAQQDAADARAESLRYKAAATHGIGEDYFDLLGSGAEDEIVARAQRIGGLLKVQAENEQLKAELEALRTGKPAPATGRPTAALKPGATPENAKTEDDVLYEQLYPSRSPA